MSEALNDILEVFGPAPTDAELAEAVRVINAIPAPPPAYRPIPAPTEPGYYFYTTRVERNMAYVTLMGDNSLWFKFTFDKTLRPLANFTGRGQWWSRIPDPTR